jgi:hypothetical protein
VLFAHPQKPIRSPKLVALRTCAPRAIKCIFGWGKQHVTMRKTKHRSVHRVAGDFLLNLIAYNLVRIPNSSRFDGRTACNDARDRAPRPQHHIFQTTIHRYARHNPAIQRFSANC